MKMWVKFGTPLNLPEASQQDRVALFSTVNEVTTEKRHNGSIQLVLCNQGPEAQRSHQIFTVAAKLKALAPHLKWVHKLKCLLKV